MTDNKQATLELGTKPIGKLLWQYAMPAIIAMTASSLYNMVDSIFIGHGVGALAISGLAITFPLMNLSAAFGAMVGVGASTILSVRLGQKDYAVADRIFGNCLTLKIITGLIFMTICLVWLNPILEFSVLQKTLCHTLATTWLLSLLEMFSLIFISGRMLCCAQLASPKLPCTAQSSPWR